MRPRKSSFANEKPAKVENSATERAVMTATTTEFHSAGQKFTSEPSTTWMLASSRPPGSGDGIRSRAMVAGSEDASSTANHSGATEASRTTVRIA